jgi:hypothetical protein
MMDDQSSEGLYLHTGQQKHRISTQTYMFRVGFQPTISVLERPKTSHALDNVVVVFGHVFTYNV